MSSEKDKKAKTEQEEQPKSDSTTETNSESDSSWFKPIYLLIPLLVLPPIGVAILTYIPFYPDLNPEFYSPPNTPELIGVLEPNSDLNQAELLFTDLAGAESTVFIKGYLYSGLLNGKIVKIKGAVIETFIDCDEKKDNDCGRALGLRTDVESKTLYVADSIKGLYKIDLATKDVTILHSALNPIGGHVCGLVDDLTVSTEGDIYFTDATYKWGFGEMHMDIIESAPNGRILHYDPRTNSTRLILDQLYFPNGIQIEAGENSLIFSESTRHRILRYYLRGPNQGGVEVISDNLPGIPDNIRASGRGTYWVSLVVPRLVGKPSFNEMLAPFPWLRKLIVRAPFLPTLPLQIYDNLFGSKISIPLIEFVNSILMSVGGGLGSYGLIIELDSNGNIIRSLHSQDAKVHSISQVSEYKNTLYMGSPWENGIWKLSLQKTEKS